MRLAAVGSGVYWAKAADRPRSAPSILSGVLESHCSLDCHNAACVCSLYPGVRTQQRPLRSEAQSRNFFLDHLHCPGCFHSVLYHGSADSWCPQETSLHVSMLVTMIAAVHYLYMRVQSVYVRLCLCCLLHIHSLSSTIVRAAIPVSKCFGRP